jgi:hypothetical protein
LPAGRTAAARAKRLVGPDSRCDAAGHRTAEVDVLPLLSLLVLAAPAEPSSVRLQREAAELRKSLEAACPERRAAIARLEHAEPKERAQLLTELEPCGRAQEAYFIQLGAALDQVGDFPRAEVAFRRALAMRVTESAQLGLLIALSRQPKLSAAQRADLDANLSYFRQHPCTRDDLCAALSYAAWHLEDTALATSSGERAISLGFEGWQPYFTTGTIYASGSPEQRQKAATYLREAKRRNGPAKAIDGFLTDLGAAP